MLSLKEFRECGLEFSLSCNSIYGGVDTEKEESVNRNDKCGDVKRTLYKEDGTICCTETTYLCCPT